MGIQIRAATVEDAPAACGVLRRSILECCVQDHQNDSEALESWLGNKTPDNVAGWIHSAANYMLVAERDAQLVGVALVTQAGKLSLCYLLPEAQHAGIGKALLEAVETQARYWGIGVLRLHGTAAGRAFFTRHGYVLAGKEKACYGIECDFFWKKLNAAANDVPQEKKRFCSCSAQ